jgi:predicted kinase
MKKFILVLNGPMCAGKSTITKTFMQREGVFRGSYDAIKWLLSNYSSENSYHKDSAKEIIFSAISKAVELGFSVVIDGGFGDYRKRYKDLAQEHEYAYVSVNIEADEDVLKERFLARVESAKIDNGKKLSVTTLDGFQKRYDEYANNNKDVDAVTFNSGVLPMKEIVAQIDNLIDTN